MGESGSPRRAEPGDRGDGEFLQFGGLPGRWLAGPLRLPGFDRPVRIVLAALVIGLLAGFFGGRLTAHPAEQKPRPRTPLSTPAIAFPFATAVISATGARCAVQVGQDLQLGLEITNRSPDPVTLGRITPTFPLGGLRTISTGIGTCGELSATEIPPSALLSPGATTWVHATVAVREVCPQALPVWFRVGFESAGRVATVVLAGFPDLGPVAYKHCAHLDADFSSPGSVSVDFGRRPFV